MLLKKNLLYVLSLMLFVGFAMSCSDEGNEPNPDDQTPVDDNPTQTGFDGTVEFVKTFGGSQEDEAVGIVQANDGGLVIAGSTSSTDGDITDKTTTDSDFWLLKVDANGQIVWNKTYGGTADDKATSIIKTNDGGYLVSGHSRSNDGDVGGNEGFHDFWLLKTDGNGNMQWETNFGFSGSDQAYKVIQTQEGGYFATGFLDVTASGGQGNDGRGSTEGGREGNRHGVGEYWGIKMNANGQKQWRRYFGGSNNDRSYDVLQMVDGSYLMIGASESDDFDKVDPKGSYDFWAVKVSPGGEKVWTKSFGGSEIDIAYAVTQTTDGNYIMVGDSRSEDKDVTNPKGNADAWVVKFDNDGNRIWQKSYGGDQFESARSIKRLANGTYLISASTRSANGDVSNNIGQNDAWVFIINENGAIQYQKSIGGTDLDFAEDAIYTTSDNVWVVGNTESNDVDIPQNKGVKDLLLIKIK